MDEHEDGSSSSSSSSSDDNVGIGDGDGVDFSLMPGPVDELIQLFHLKQHQLPAWDDDLVDDPGHIPADYEEEDAADHIHRKAVRAYCFEKHLLPSPGKKWRWPRLGARPHWTPFQNETSVITVELRSDRRGRWNGTAVDPHTGRAVSPEYYISHGSSTIPSCQFSTLETRDRARKALRPILFLGEKRRLLVPDSDQGTIVPSPIDGDYDFELTASGMMLRYKQQRVNWRNLFQLLVFLKASDFVWLVNSSVYERLVDAQGQGLEAGPETAAVDRAQKRIMESLRGVRLVSVPHGSSGIFVDGVAILGDIDDLKLGEDWGAGFDGVDDDLLVPDERIYSVTVGSNGYALVGFVRKADEWSKVTSFVGILLQRGKPVFLFERASLCEDLTYVASEYCVARDATRVFHTPTGQEIEPWFHDSDHADGRFQPVFRKGGYLVCQDDWNVPGVFCLKCEVEGIHSRIYGRPRVERSVLVVGGFSDWNWCNIIERHYPQHHSDVVRAVVFAQRLLDLEYRMAPLRPLSGTDVTRREFVFGLAAVFKQFQVSDDRKSLREIPWCATDRPKHARSVEYFVRRLLLCLEIARNDKNSKSPLKVLSYDVLLHGILPFLSPFQVFIEHSRALHLVRSCSNIVLIPPEEGAFEEAVVDFSEMTTLATSSTAAPDIEDAVAEASSAMIAILPSLGQAKAPIALQLTESVVALCRSAPSFQESDSAVLRLIWGDLAVSLRQAVLSLSSFGFSEVRIMIMKNLEVLVCGENSLALEVVETFLRDADASLELIELRSDLVVSLSEDSVRRSGMTDLIAPGKSSPFESMRSRILSPLLYASSPHLDSFKKRFFAKLLRVVLAETVRETPRGRTIPEQGILLFSDILTEKYVSELDDVGLFDLLNAIGDVFVSLPRPFLKAVLQRGPSIIRDHQAGAGAILQPLLPALSCLFNVFGAECQEVSDLLPIRLSGSRMKRARALLHHFLEFFPILQRRAGAEVCSCRLWFDVLKWTNLSAWILRTSWDQSLLDLCLDAAELLMDVVAYLPKAASPLATALAQILYYRSTSLPFRERCSTLFSHVVSLHDETPPVIRARLERDVLGRKFPYDTRKCGTDIGRRAVAALSHLEADSRTPKEAVLLESIRLVRRALVSGCFSISRNDVPVLFKSLVRADFGVPLLRGLGVFPSDGVDPSLGDRLIKEEEEKKKKKSVWFEVPDGCPISLELEEEMLLLVSWFFTDDAPDFYKTLVPREELARILFRALSMHPAPDDARYLLYIDTARLILRDPRRLLQEEEKGWRGGHVFESVLCDLLSFQIVETSNPQFVNIQIRNFEFLLEVVETLERNRSLWGIVGMRKVVIMTLQLLDADHGCAKSFVEFVVSRIQTPDLVDQLIHGLGVLSVDQWQDRGRSVLFLVARVAENLMSKGLGTFLAPLVQSTQAPTTILCRCLKAFEDGGDALKPSLQLWTILLPHSSFWQEFGFPPFRLRVEAALPMLVGGLAAAAPEDRPLFIRFFSKLAESDVLRDETLRKLAESLLPILESPSLMQIEDVISMLSMVVVKCQHEEDKKKLLKKEELPSLLRTAATTMGAVSGLPSWDDFAAATSLSPSPSMPGEPESMANPDFAPPASVSVPLAFEPAPEERFYLGSPFSSFSFDLQEEQPRPDQHPRRRRRVKHVGSRRQRGSDRVGRRDPPAPSASAGEHDGWDLGEDVFQF